MLERDLKFFAKSGQRKESVNCYTIPRLKKYTSPGKAQLFLLMRSERKFSSKSSHILKYMPVNWNWNHSLFEGLGVIQFNSLPKDWNRDFSRSHHMWYLDLGRGAREPPPPQQTSGEGETHLDVTLVPFLPDCGVLFLLFQGLDP